MLSPALIAVAAAIAAVPPPAQATTLAHLRWERRVLLVAAPNAADPALAAQRPIFTEIAGSGDTRDLVLVEVLGDTVRGVTDTAASLRRVHKLPADRFTVLLIGKDGGEKRRSATPMSVATLTATIDAMPMRQSGER